jgi:hypothetical protein
LRSVGVVEVRHAEVAEVRRAEVGVVLGAEVSAERHAMAVRGWVAAV